MKPAPHGLRRRPSGLAPLPRRAMARGFPPWLAGLLIFAMNSLPADSLANNPPEAPSGLLLDLLPEPLGVENPRPAMSWIVNDPDPEETQTAYQVLFADRPGQLALDKGNVWDSGKVLSSQSTNVLYAGPPLEPEKVFHWKARTWDRHGLASPYSRPAMFATGVGVRWRAVPIWAGGDGPSLPDFAFLRNSFPLPDKEIQSAVAHVTALCPEPAAQYVYKLHINGHFVGAGPERGFGGIHRYNSFNVAGLLRPGGENVVGSINYSSGRRPPGHDLERIEERRFLFQMRVVFADGSDLTVGSGGNWKGMDGDRVYRDLGNAGFDHYYYAPREGLDGRAYPFGWNAPGFDDSAWRPAVEREPVPHLQPSITRNTERHLAEPALAVLKGEGHWYLDFGRAVVAGLRLELEGEEEREVEIRLGEELSAPLTVRHEMRTGNTYQETWTLKEGRQSLENFGYRVFRHAEILNAPRGFRGEDARAVVMRHPFDPAAARFESCDPVLNAVWELCKYSIKATSLDLYVDTHTRERRNYEGDALINQLSHYAVDREHALARYSIEYLCHRPTWPTEYKLQSAMMAWQDFLHTGNADSLARSYRLLKTKTLEEFLNADHLVEKPPDIGGRHGRDLVDWPASQRDGYEFTSVNTVINSFACRAFEDLARIAGVLHEEEDAAHYHDLAVRTRRAINDLLFDTAAGRFKDGLTSSHHSLHANAFPLALGLVRPGYIASVADYVQSRGMAVSVYGSWFLLEGLYRAGRGEAARSLMNAVEGNSWGHMTRNLGATIVTEAWDPSQKPNMSFSHAWASAPASVIPRGLFGVKPLEPGFDRFQIKPQPGGLDWAVVQVPSIKGPIGVEFANRENVWEMTVVIPVNTVARVHVPLSDGRSGHAVSWVGRETGGVEENGYMVFPEVGSGTHLFRVAPSP